MTSSAHIHQYELGPMNNFAYILEDPSTKKAAVIDPAWDIPFLLNELKKNQLELEMILLTHGHYDHTSGLFEVLNYKKIPVYLSETEASSLTPQVPTLQKTRNHDRIPLGTLSIECRHTPGHSPGGQCFHVDTLLLTGDTLFIDRCGRCDLAYGDAAALYHSFQKEILPLPDATRLYPGHNYGHIPSDLLGNQRKTNPYLRCKTEAEFIRLRSK